MCSFTYDDDTGYHDYVECQDCKEANDKLYNIEKALTQVVKQLYSEDRLDVALLDDSLGQICDYVGYPMPANLPRVKRRESIYFEFAESINQ